MTGKARTSRRIAALGSAAVLAVGLLSSGAGAAVASGALDCP